MVLHLLFILVSFIHIFYLLDVNTQANYIPACNSVSQIHHNTFKTNAFLFQRLPERHKHATSMLYLFTLTGSCSICVLLAKNM